MPPDTLTAIIAQILELPPGQIGEDSGLNVTDNWDSIRNMFIMMEVEKQFGLQLAFNTYTEVATVKDIRAFIARHQG